MPARTGQQYIDGLRAQEREVWLGGERVRDVTRHKGLSGGVKAIASLTESGSTALWMSRLNCGVPIYALTAQTETRYRCTLFRDVYPLMVKYVGHDREELLAEAESVLVKNGIVKDGDLIVLTIGEPIGKAGGTNTMKIVKVGEHRSA